MAKKKLTYIQCIYSRLVPIEKMKPNPENPNRHSKAQIEAIAKILKYSGMRKPIVVGRKSGFMVTGHATLEAMRLNGWTQIPVNDQTFRDAAQEYSHMVADNALQQWSELDRTVIDAKLEGMLKDLDVEMLGYQEFIKKLDAELDAELPKNEDVDWSDAIQSATVRKIMLFYSAEVYKTVMEELTELSEQRKSANLSDLVASLVHEAVGTKAMGKAMRKSINANTVRI